MTQKSTLVIAAALVIVLLGGLYIFIQSQNNASVQIPTTQTPTIAPQAQQTPTPEPSAENADNAVTITSSGFSPEEIKIKVGDTVTWVNQDTAAHQVNSAPHPQHTLYPVLNTVGLLKAGDSKSASFSQTGAYAYHDHLFPQNKGTVIVE